MANTISGNYSLYQQLSVSPGFHVIFLIFAKLYQPYKDKVERFLIFTFILKLLITIICYWNYLQINRCNRSYITLKSFKYFRSVSAKLSSKTLSGQVTQQQQKISHFMYKSSQTFPLCPFRLPTFSKVEVEYI